MFHIGITGSRNPVEDGRLKDLRSVLASYGHNNTTLHHGDCLGVDTHAHHIAITYGFIIHVHPPSNSIHRAWNIGDIMSKEKPYLARNKDIVSASYILIALPSSRTEHLRSGSWATIRYARKKGIEVIIL